MRLRGPTWRSRPTTSERRRRGSTAAAAATRRGGAGASTRPGPPCCLWAPGAAWDDRALRLPAGEARAWIVAGEDERGRGRCWPGCVRSRRGGARHDAWIAELRDRFEVDDPLLRSLFVHGLANALSGRKELAGARSRATPPGTPTRCRREATTATPTGRVQALLPFAPERAAEQLRLLAQGVEPDGTAPSAVVRYVRRRHARLEARAARPIRSWRADHAARRRLVARPRRLAVAVRAAGPRRGRLDRPARAAARRRGRRQPPRPASAGSRTGCCASGTTAGCRRSRRTTGTGPTTWSVAVRSPTTSRSRTARCGPPRTPGRARTALGRTRGARRPPACARRPRRCCGTRRPATFASSCRPTAGRRGRSRSTRWPRCGSAWRTRCRRGPVSTPLARGSRPATTAPSRTATGACPACGRAIRTGCRAAARRCSRTATTTAATGRTGTASTPSSC